MSNLSELLPSGGGQNLVEFVASGTLPNGKPVVLKSNGTVEVVGETSTPVSEDLTGGSIATFDGSGPCYHNTISYDPFDSSKFIINWRASGASNYGKTIIGTVSGTSITFGSAYVFNSGHTESNNVVFDSKTQNSLLFAYQDGPNGNNYGRARVGTVSGTSITFGSEYTFGGYYIGGTDLVSDPNNAGKFVIIWKGDSSSLTGKSVIATVTGTSISFGTSVDFDSSIGDEIPSVHFDPFHPNKFLVAFSEASSPRYGRVRLGTISGTTISYGTAANFHDATVSTKTYITVRFDQNTSGRFIVAYILTSPSNDSHAVVGTVAANEAITFGSTTTAAAGTTERLVLQVDHNTPNKFIVTWQGYAVWPLDNMYAKVGTISGTTISYGSQLSVGGRGDDSLAIAFISGSAHPGKFVYARNDGSKGVAETGQMGSTLITTNLTATNLIGITSEATADTATAKINTWGGINEAQTSLTIASDYYAQTDGTITTTSTSPAQKVGTAISTTTINMKDLT
jgi:hypothetical protein